MVKTHLERVQNFDPDYLVKKGHEHFMVKDGINYYIHKSTFDAVKSQYEVIEK